jgi:DNA-binding NtrC family response regulator
MTQIGWSQVIADAGQGAKVLLVDDEADVRNALQRLVVRLGYHTRTAASSEEADQWLSNERFDVCLLDIQLPRMNGVEFLGWALKRDPEMAVIMLSGLDHKDVAIECLDHGARTYLVKPVDPDFLRLALRDAVAMHNLLVQRNRLSEP